MQLSLPSWLSLLATHQSLMLGGMSLLICTLALVWVFRLRVWGYRVEALDEDGKPTGTYEYRLHAGYFTVHKLLRLIGWLLGAYMTYATVYLGYYHVADPLTIALLFLGGAIGMHLQKHIPWAWLAAPIVAGLGITQLWGVLAADPSWQVTLGSVAALSLPTFILLTYFERMHQSLGEVLTTTRLAIVVAAVMMLQAVTLWAGVSLWGIVQTGIDNIIQKIIQFVGGLS